MEKILSAAPMMRECKLKQNPVGLFDVLVQEENGAVVADIKGITLPRAVTVIEDYMYTSRRRAALNE